MIAETAAWREGDLSRMVPEQIPSPWYRANQQLHQTSPEMARAVLLDSFAYTGQPSLVASRRSRRVRPCAPSLPCSPSPLPTGNPYSEQALADILVRLGEYTTAAHYAADSYRRSPSPISAFAVARSAAALGDPVAFANFGFAESHSLSPSPCSSTPAVRLQAHYPAAFLAALASHQPMGFYSPQSLVHDARRHGVEVLVRTSLSGAEAGLEGERGKPPPGSTPAAPRLAPTDVRRGRPTDAGAPTGRPTPYASVLD